MASALMKSTVEAGVVRLDLQDAFAAALLRAAEAGCPEQSVFSFVKKSDWSDADARNENILVHDPD